MLYLLFGSPTLELLAASYNNRSNKSNIIELGLGTNGHTYNIRSNWLKVEDNHGIYNKSTSSYWWLASPYDYRDCDGTYVFAHGGDIEYADVESRSYAVRPVVCIPTSVFNSKYLTSLVDI